VQLIFFLVKASDAAVKTAILLTPSSTAFYNPFSFATNTGYLTPGLFLILEKTSAWSASFQITKVNLLKE